MVDITPLIIIISLGFLFGFFDDSKRTIENSLNKYLYYFALPLTIFYKTSDAKLDFLDLNFVLINSLPIILITLIIFLMFKLNILTNNFSRTLIIITTLGNLVYLGFPVIKKTVGEEYITDAALTMVIQNITIFSFCLFIINLICSDNKCIKISYSKILKNPLLISSILGVFFNSTKLNFSFLKEVLKEISYTTTPLALIVIGMGIKGVKIDRDKIKKLITVAIFKMIILPIIVFLFIYFLNLNDISYKVVFLQYTMPVAFANYTISIELELEKELVVQAIILTTILFFILYPFYKYLLGFLF